jgi:Flp pilus assembly protein TadG
MAPAAANTRGRRRRRGAKDESGVALTEFALVLPLLLVLLMAVLDFGVAFSTWIDQTHLVNEGARWAVVNKNPGSGSLQDYIRSQADSDQLRNGGSASVPDPMNVTICFPAGTSRVGDPVEVQTSVTYNWLPFLGDRIDITQTTISASARMRLEAVPTNYTANGTCT